MKDQGNCTTGEAAAAEISSESRLTAQQVRLPQAPAKQQMNVALPTPDRMRLNPTSQIGSKPKTILSNEKSAEAARGSSEALRLLGAAEGQRKASGFQQNP